MKNKIIFADIVSGYNVINRFMDDLKLSFENLGYEAYYLSGSVSRAISLNEIAFIFCFNGALNDATSQFADANGVPVISFFVDKPESHYGRIAHMPSNNIMLFVDRYHVNFFMNNTHIKNRSLFVPHGGSECGNKESVPFEERTIDILFCGGYVDHRIFRDRFICENVGYGNLFEHIVNELFADYSIPFEILLDKLLSTSGIRKKTEKYTAACLQCTDIYDYYRYKYRNDTLKLLLDRGYKITCCGNGWNETEFIKYPNFLYLGVRYFGDILEMVRNSRITLNIMPTFKNGSHERIFNAMLNNSVCLSTGTSAFDEDLRDEETVLFYDLNRPDEMCKKIDLVLGSMEKLQQITDDAYRVASQKHTWANRAAQILDAKEELF